MPLNPENARYFEMLKEKEVEQRRQEMLPEFQRAAEVGRRLGHRQVSGVYFWEEKVRFLSVMLFGGLATAFGWGAVLLVAFFGDSLPGLDGLLGPLLAVVFCASLALPIVGGLIVLVANFVLPRRRDWIYLYPGGLAEVDFKGRLVCHALWPEFCGADWVWSLDEDYLGSTFQLRYASGGCKTFLLSHRNALNPARFYTGERPIRPRSRGDAPPAFPTFLEAVDQLLVGPLAQQVLDRCAAGETIDFGRLSLNDSGIVYGNKPVLRWDEVGNVNIGDAGRMRLWRRGDVRHCLNVSLDRIPDRWLLTRVIVQRTNLPAG